MVVGRNGRKLLLRVPAGMDKALADAAAVEGRSRNTDIVVRLADSIGYPLETKSRRNSKRK